MEHSSRSSRGSGTSPRSRSPEQFVTNGKPTEICPDVTSSQTDACSRRSSVTLRFGRYRGTT